MARCAAFAERFSQQSNTLTRVIGWLDSCLGRIRSSTHMVMHIHLQELPRIPAHLRNDLLQRPGMSSSNPGSRAWQRRGQHWFDSCRRGVKGFCLPRGRYHSHPHITVLPSHVDVRTQASYQMLDRNFVGLIISAFNEARPLPTPARIQADTLSRIPDCKLRTTQRLLGSLFTVRMEGPVVHYGFNQQFQFRKFGEPDVDQPLSRHRRLEHCPRAMPYYKSVRHQHDIRLKHFSFWQWGAGVAGCGHPGTVAGDYGIPVRVRLGGAAGVTAADRRLL